MKKYIVSFVTCAASLMMFTGMTHFAYADTRIGGDLKGNYTMTEAGSPYLIGADLNILQGHTLTVEPGVTIKPDPKFANAAALNVSGGTLIMNGTSDKRITVEGLRTFYVFGNGTTTDTFGRASISFADIRVLIYAANSNVNIDRSTIGGASATGLISWQSNVTISDSTIKDSSAYGIHIYRDSYLGSSFSIHNSVFVNNTKNALLNDTWIIASAENNWWGSADGPAYFGINSVNGNVNFTPWLTSPPDWTRVATSSPCCSSILFIPGLEGTRLYRPESLPLGLGSSNNRLWEPNTSSDVKKLYLNSDGSSSDSSVYSGQPIDSVFGLYGVYGKFMNFLDGLVKKGNVNEWRAFGYDWRRPIAEVVAGTENKATTTESLVDIVSRMASSSKTGKVTLVAHSNGGLVAKYLVKTLMDLGKENLIDSVISVGVPYLGTPEAIAGLLHGDHQSILYGLIASQATARGLGENMASAYSLLPSAQFFQSAFSPTIAFASTTLAGINDGSYPLQINNSVSQSAFVSDTNNVRNDPDPSDTSLPIKGNTALMAAAEALHGLLDPMVWPKSIANWAIVGWDAATTKLVTYKESTVCKIKIVDLLCADRPTHDLAFTNNGDGTVVANSAAYGANQVVPIDLKIASKNDGKTITHGNLLESSTTESIIGLITSASSTGDQSATMAKISTIPGVSSGSSIIASNVEPVELRISTHSPVKLNVYDDKGNHTGPIPLPTAASGPDSYYTGAYETNIPDSDYQTYDNGDGADTYITLKDPSKTFKIVAEGTDLGFATLDVEKVQGSTVLDNVEYSQFPVTPFSEAKVNISGTVLNQGDTTRISSSTALAVDLDGDGKTDVSQVVNPGALPDPTVAAKAAEKMVIGLIGSEPHGKQLAGRIEHIIDLISKGKLKKAQSQTASFELHLGHMKITDISADDKKKIIDMVEAMITAIEQAQ